MYFVWPNLACLLSVLCNLFVVFASSRLALPVLPSSHQFYVLYWQHTLLCAFFASFSLPLLPYSGDSVFVVITSPHCLLCLFGLHIAACEATPFPQFTTSYTRIQDILSLLLSLLFWFDHWPSVNYTVWAHIFTATIPNLPHLPPGSQSWSY